MLSSSIKSTQQPTMDSYTKLNLIDEEMEKLIDNAIASADKFALESAKEFEVLDSNIKEVIEDSERALKRSKTDIGMSLIFVSEEAIEHLRYVQSLREFLQAEARRMMDDIMMDDIMKKRKMEKATKSGKKRARKN